MLSHLKLHFNTSQRNDEAVLGAYPSTIRRRVLRFLYLDILRAGGAGGCCVSPSSAHCLGRGPRKTPALLTASPGPCCRPASCLTARGNAS